MMEDVFITSFGPMLDTPKWAVCVMSAAPRRNDNWYDMRFRISKVAVRVHDHMVRRSCRRFESGGIEAVRGL